MPLLALWVVTAPFAGGVLIASSARLRGLVARHLAASLVLGWASLSFVVGSIVLLGHDPDVATLFAAPLIGLAFWRPGRGDDPPDDGEDPGPDDGGGIDWDEFQRRLDEWARRPLVHS